MMGFPFSAHGNELFGQSWVNSKGSIEVSLGCACIHGHSKSLHEFSSVRPNQM